MAFYVRYRDIKDGLEKEKEFDKSYYAEVLVDQLKNEGHEDVRVVNEGHNDVINSDTSKLSLPRQVNSNSNSNSNSIGVSLTLLWIGISLIILSFIGGIIAGKSSADYSDEFNIAAAIIYWACGFVSGFLFIGFAEVIKLLDQINKKMPTK